MVIEVWKNPASSVISSTFFFQGPPPTIGMHIRDRVTRSGSSFEVVPSSSDISVGMVIPPEMHPK